MPERTRNGTGSAADFTLGEWLVQPSLNRITRGEAGGRLRPQLMNLLVCLAERPGQTVTRETILSVVWPGQYIADTGLARCIAELRSALGDAAGQDARYIETIPKRGYRLIAPVGPAPATAAVAGVPADPVPTSASMPSETAAPAVEVSRPGGRNLRLFGVRRVTVVAVLAVVAVVGAVLAWRLLRAPAAVENDTLIIAFQNTTGDPVFDGALRLALSTQLEQSPYLRVVGEQRVRDALGYMNRPRDSAITRAVALEVCQRVGAKAVLAGSLAPLGRHYAVGLEGVACQSGDVIARDQVEAAGREQVLAALGQAISSIRERFGESVASIRRYDVPIAQATTASLDALKAFSQGDFERARGNDEDAVRFYRRATEIDPSFALAHVRLGLQLINVSRNTEGVAEIERAYAVRARASEGERFYITSMYYAAVLRDGLKCVEPLESWRDAYPRSAVSRFTLASMYGRIGRLEEALVQVEEALRLEPNHAMATVVLIETLARLGRVDEARRLAEAEVARGRGSISLRMLLASMAFEIGDEATLRRELEWADATPGGAPFVLQVRGLIARFGGKMRESAHVTDRRIALAVERGDQVLAARVGIEEANDRALAGQTREPLSLVLAALNRARTPETLARAALAVAWAGEFERAEEYLREYEKMPNVTPTSDPEFRPATIALITLGRGFPESALDVLAPLRPYERGWRYDFLPAYIRGLALQRLKRPAEAIAEFERIVAQRGSIPETFIFPLAFLQMGRAKAAAGDPQGARVAYEQFLRCWKDADTDLPVLVRAREELGRLRSPFER